ncbi:MULTISPECIES: CDP-glucose 4,6-dehydratase [unclassified Pseudomonas]|uniref:CDP-glucose 4,6-dehydratase n=1 Tax=unclassified Pseudomonas TaxID=196821 RepID=UPI0015B3ADEA|nr:MULTISPECIES: CDP-glucose 4,6-dehydratase [unclassified Pseudomonas]
MKQFGDLYRGRKVLLTGHTGFKGSWLATWLCELGAQVTGLGLAPESVPAHWGLLNTSATDVRGDIRDSAVVLEAFEQAQPEIVFHLAAQALVRRSYRDPLESWSTNVMGTANVLEACRLTPSVRAVVVITTDKVYANNEWPWGYRENDRLGGHDPYSASKAASELVVDSYRKAFWANDGAPLIVSARAGNVIGGGDWSEDRLIPDLVKALGSGESLAIRSPQSTRPWQHVLECLSGYLLLGQRLLALDKGVVGGWNFGPERQDNRTVSEVLTELQKYWPQLAWHTTSVPQPHEANLLYLDCAQAKARLGWQPVWSLEQGLEMTANWYRLQASTGRAITREQLADYIDAAAKAGCVWIDS